MACSDRKRVARAGNVRRSTPMPAAFAYAGRTLEEGAVEVFLLLWDEMDDWLAAWRHKLRSIT